MSSNQSKSTLANFVWRFAERCGAQAVSFVVSIVLARLLVPEVYGTIALVTVITSVLNVFVDSGLGTALIQKKDADDLDFSSVFYFNIALCAILYLLLFVVAPWFARFYGDPAMTPLIRVLGITLLISGVKNVQIAYVSKHMIFKKFFFATLGGTIGAAVVGITMAYRGFGAWALVTQQIFNNAVDTIILWVTVRWRPKWMFSWERMKDLFRYGWKLLVSGLISLIDGNIWSLIIGKVFSVSDLAFYERGAKFPDVIAWNINVSIDGVLLPIMSEEQDDCARVKAMTRCAIRTSTYVLCPIMIGMAVVAEPMIKLLLTEKWLPCVFFLRVACLDYMLFPIHTANLNAIKALGRSDLFLKLEIIKEIVSVAVTVVSLFFGLKAMVYAMLGVSIISTWINAYPNKKLIDYSWSEQMRDILPNIVLSVAMGMPVLLLQYLPIPTILILLVQVVTGIILYIAMSVLFKMEIFNYILNILKKIKNNE